MERVTCCNVVSRSMFRDNEMNTLSIHYSIRHVNLPILSTPEREFDAENVTYLLVMCSLTPIGKVLVIQGVPEKIRQ